MARGMRGSIAHGSQRAVVGLPGADAYHALDIGDEDLAVADLAGLGGLHDGLDHLINQVAAHGHLDTGLRNEVDYVLRATVELGMSTLPSKAFHLGHRHARHSDVRERRAYVVELERLDDRGDQFHGRDLPLRALPARGFCSFRATASNGVGTRAGCAAAPFWSASRGAVLLRGAARPASLGYSSVEMYQRILIVGGGQAAMQAVDTLRRRGFAGELTLVGDEPWPPYQRPPLSKKYLAGGLDRERLLIRPAAFFADHAVTTHFGRRVTDIARRERHVRLDDGLVLPYDALLLATGSRPRPLLAPGRELAGLHYLRTIADADRIRAECTAGGR